ncbi:balbiani ring protein 3-like, partial [Argonauta hians]
EILKTLRLTSYYCRKIIAKMKMQAISFGFLLLFCSEAFGRFYFPTLPNTTPGWNNRGDQTRNGGDQTRNGGSQTQNGGSQTQNGGSQTQNGGSQTRNGMYQNRTVGEGLPPDACNSVRFSNKIYYNPHPSDCTKYVSCTQLSSGNYLGVVMSCAQGRFWNDVAFTCDYPWNVQCAHDKCKSLGNPAVYQTDSSSCLMWGICSYGVTTSIQPCADLKASGTYHSMLGSCLNTRECTANSTYIPPKPCTPAPVCGISEIIDYENCRCIPNCANPPNCGINERLNRTSCRCENTCTNIQACLQSQILDLTTCRCVPRCPALYCRNNEMINYETCRCEARCQNVQSCGASQKFNDITCMCENKCIYVPSCRANERFNYETCRCEARCQNVQSCGTNQKFNDVTCMCENKCIYVPSCRANERFNYETCRCEARCQNVQSCGTNQKFNDVTCMCENKCIYVPSCRANERFNYETCRCEARCQIVQSCGTSQKLNIVSCQCEDKCTYVPICRANEKVNYDTCRCERRCQTIQYCSLAQRFNDITCQCENKCPYIPACPTNEQVNFDTCRCEHYCNVTLCDQRQRFNNVTCQCEEKCSYLPNCRNEERINYDTCRCEARCSQVTNCNANQRFDYVQCRCIDQCLNPPICRAGEQLDLLNCRCVNVFCPQGPICQNGETLDNYRCICTRSATFSTTVRPTGIDCKPAVNINFQNLNTINSRFLHVEGVTTKYNPEAEDNYTGVFDGHCQILLTRFNFGNTIPPIAISLRYRLDKYNMGLNPYALITNSNNMQEPSILIAATSSYIIFGIKTREHGFKTTKVLTSGSDWESVGLIYDGHQLIGQVGDYLQKTPMSGTVEGLSNSLVIGAGHGYENFRGEIDYVRFFQCNPDP